MADYKKLREDLQQPIEKTGEWVAENNMEDASVTIEELQAENERLKKKLEEAVADIPHHCGTCIHNYVSSTDNANCDIVVPRGCEWQWRGEEEKDGDTNG